MIDKKIEAINATLSRIMWLVLGGIIMGAVGFMLKGGFNLPWRFFGFSASVEAQISHDSHRQRLAHAAPEGLTGK